MFRRQSQSSNEEGGDHQQGTHQSSSISASGHPSTPPSPPHHNHSTGLSSVEEGLPLSAVGGLPSPIEVKIADGSILPRRHSSLERRGSEITTGSEYGGSVITAGEGASRPSSSHKRRKSGGTGGGGSTGSSGFHDITRHVSNSFQLSFDIVRAISQVDQLVYCQICREYENKGQTFKLSACGHRFCRSCVSDYLDIKIREGQVYPTCFYCDEKQVQQDRDNATIPAPCAKPVTPEDIRALVSSEVWLRYEKFKFNKENKNARSCPYCDALELGDPAIPEMICAKCGKKFCYFHANAHEGKTCTDYEKIMHEENLKNQALISTIAKPCPGCGAPVEKAGGCNQMKCYACGEHFCWLCGKLVDGGTFPDHFQWWNVLGGCPNMQMQEDIAPPPPSQVKMMKILSIMQVIFVGPAAVILGLAFYLVCFPCFFAKWIMDRQTKMLKTHFTGCISFWGNTVVAVLFIPVFITIIILFFVFTFFQVLLGSISARFGVCFGGDDDDDAGLDSNRHSTASSKQQQQQQAHRRASSSSVLGASTTSATAAAAATEAGSPSLAGLLNMALAPLTAAQASVGSSPMTATTSTGGEEDDSGIAKKMEQGDEAEAGSGEGNGTTTTAAATELNEVELQV